MNIKTTSPENALMSTEHRRSRSRTWAIAGLVLLLLIVGTAVFVYASYPLVRGYANHSYIPDGEYTEGVDVAPEPTDKAVQSKLWYHDDSWWGVVWNPEAGEYRIYELLVDSQEWVDTGVYVDHRLNSRSDVLWDEANNRLYIATHRKQENPSNQNTNPDNWAYLQQYHYNAGNRTWVADDDGIADGTGVITNYIVESLTIDQDSTGRLWATYVARQDEATAPYWPPSETPEISAPEGGVSHYYVTVSTTDDPETWTAPDLWTEIPQAEVVTDDISGLVTFTDASGPKVGLLWSNQRTGEFYFALRNDGDPAGDWTLDPAFEALKASIDPISADDHMNFAVTENGDLLAIVKTSANQDPDNEDTLIGIFARDNVAGSWSWHPVSPSDSVDTRPLVLVNETTDTVYAFSVSSTGGGTICYQDAPLPADLTTLSFPPGGCDPSDPFSSETLFISHYIGGFENISNPTSTKQRLTDASGMVVLASDDVNGHVYVHNMEGGGAPDQPPPATPTPVPGGEETDVYLPAFYR